MPTQTTNQQPTLSTLARQNTTADGSAGDQEVATVRDEIVIGVWMGTLPPTIEQDLKTRTTSTGTWYDDLASPTCDIHVYVTCG
jgi:hypothetical protein